MKKRILLSCCILLILMLVCVSLSACDSTEEEILYVYNWGEYISDGSEGSLDVNAAFEEYCRDVLGRNVKVNYSTFSSNESMYAKINSGSAAYDVIIPSDYMIERMVSENLLLPLDLTKIPNYKHIREEFKGDNVYYEGNSDKVPDAPAESDVFLYYNPVDNNSAGKIKSRNLSNYNQRYQCRNVGKIVGKRFCIVFIGKSVIYKNKKKCENDSIGKT